MSEKPTIDVSKSRPSTESNYKCKCCGRTWEDEWGENDEKSWGGRSGGSTYYNCPTEGCDGQAVVHW